MPVKSIYQQPRRQLHFRAALTSGFARAQNWGGIPFKIGEVFSRGAYTPRSEVVANTPSSGCLRLFATPSTTSMSLTRRQQPNSELFTTSGLSGKHCHPNSTDRLQANAGLAEQMTEPSGTAAEGIGYQSSVGGERITRTTLTLSAHGCTVSQCSRAHASTSWSGSCRTSAVSSQSEHQAPSAPSNRPQVISQIEAAIGMQHDMSWPNLLAHPISWGWYANSSTRGLARNAKTVEIATTLKGLVARHETGFPRF